MKPQDILSEDATVGALVKLGLAVGEIHRNPNPGGRDFVLLVDGAATKIEYLERPDTPIRKTGIVVVHDAASFVNVTNRYLDKKAAAIYATLKPAGFVAVLNDNGATSDKPNWRDHRVSFTPEFSKEHQLWDSRKKQPMTQEQFAHFIEDNLPDFKTPEGARMLEIAVNFKVNRAVTFKSAINLSDGSAQLEYSDQQAGGGTGPSKKLAMPELFKIEIPVWAGLGAQKYVFDARLRYRVSEGQLSILYDLIRPHKVVERAFQDILDTIRKDVKDVPIFFGSAG